MDRLREHIGAVFMKEQKLDMWVPKNGDEIYQTSIMWDIEQHCLDIQTFCSYGYQRELHIRQALVDNRLTVFDPNNNGLVPFVKKEDWLVSAYKHPFKPPVQSSISRSAGQRLVDRIKHLTENYPTLLWTLRNHNQISGAACHPYHLGFVHFHDQLLHGAVPSVNLLK